MQRAPEKEGRRDEREKIRKGESVLLSSQHRDFVIMY